MEAAAASARVLRVAAICGSLRKASFNRGLLRAGTLPLLLPCSSLPSSFFVSSLTASLPRPTNYPAAAEVCEDSIPGLRVDELDISDLPLINTDLETGGGTGFPPAVEAFRAKVCQADCFLFGAPEYNYSIASTSFAPLPLSSSFISDLLPARTNWKGIAMDKMPPATNFRSAFHLHSFSNQLQHCCHEGKLSNAIHYLIFNLHQFEIQFRHTELYGVSQSLRGPSYPVHYCQIRFTLVCHSAQWVGPI